MPTKSCSLDPIPTNLTKQYLNDIIPLITRIINTSLTSGTVPSQFKQAIVTPILKKKNLDNNHLKNYRPISNLPFLSKVLERVVLNQLQNHLHSNNLVETHQAAYRKNHSTETALLYTTNNLLLQNDSHNISAVGLLDLSAAFDTLDHKILLERLHKTFGLQDTVLGWFESYLLNRRQSVVADGAKSNPTLLSFGVPQGSVLGPILFTLYTQPLSTVIQRNNCSYQKYADDTEITSSGHPSSFFNLHVRISGMYRQHF